MTSATTTTTPATGAAPRPAPARRPVERASSGAVWLALATFAIAASAVPSLRPRVAGLALHPYLLLLAPALPLVLTRVGSVDRRILRGATVFAVLWILSMLPSGLSVGLVVKFLAAIVTALTAATLVRSERDFTVVVLALTIAIAIISARGLWLGFEDEDAAREGITVLKDIGNKNAFSLYGLPALLLAGWVFTRMHASVLERAVLIAGAAATVGAMFATTNRSGWLGVALIGVMLTFGRLSARSVALLAVIVIAVYLVLGNLSGTRDMVERRINQTTGQNVSDDIRQELFVRSFEIGLSHPLLGVSPQELPKRLARALRIPQPVVDPHNVYAYVVGGSGVFALAALAAFVFGFAFPGTSRGRTTAHQLCVMMGILWVMRGGFTHEILFSPTFSLGLGLGPGLVVAQQRLAAQRRRSAAPARVAPPALRSVT